MKCYVLVANKQKDFEYQYADFDCLSNDRSLVFFRFDMLRIGVMKVIDFFHLRDSKVVKRLYFNRIYKREVLSRLTIMSVDEPVFIIMGGVYGRYGTSLIEHLKNEYPNALFVAYFVDLIKSLRINIEKAKTDFDLLCSFDEKDARVYGMKFVREPFSVRCIEKIELIQNPKYDVTFVGGARNRFALIISAFEKLKQMNLKLDFHITEVKRKNQVYTDEIEYGYLSFDEVIKHVNDSKCVLEIMQKDGYSATARYAEAMLFGRNILTNCEELSKDENNENNIFYFEDVDDINSDVMISPQLFDREKYIKKFSNEQFIKTIEEYLGK